MVTAGRILSIIVIVRIMLKIVRAVGKVTAATTF
jgi:hypothetical protein